MLHLKMVSWQLHLFTEYYVRTVTTLGDQRPTNVYQVTLHGAATKGTKGRAQCRQFPTE